MIGPGRREGGKAGKMLKGETRYHVYRLEVVNEIETVLLVGWGNKKERKDFSLCIEAQNISRDIISDLSGLNMPKCCEQR